MLDVLGTLDPSESPSTHLQGAVEGSACGRCAQCIRYLVKKKASDVDCTWWDAAILLGRVPQCPHLGEDEKLGCCLGRT